MTYGTTTFQASDCDVVVGGGSPDELRRLNELVASWQLGLDGLVKAAMVDEALELLSGDAFVSTESRIAVRGGAVVSLPLGDVVEVQTGGLATSGTITRSWGSEDQGHDDPIDTSGYTTSESPWIAITVAASSCFAAELAATLASLHGTDGPDWLDSLGLPGRFVGVYGEIVENGCWSRQASRPLEPSSRA